MTRSRVQADRYREIAARGDKALGKGSVELDGRLLGPECDGRLGLSLILRPDPLLAPRYAEIVSRFRGIDPDQYYYPFDDLHITVFDLIAAHEGFDRRMIDIEECLALSREAVNGRFPFDIDFKELIFGEAAGMLAGFDRGELATMRDAIRKTLLLRGLPNMERYASVTAHMTFCRFVRPLRKFAEFARLAHALARRPLGNMRVAAADLVINDWYNRARQRETISTVRFG
jgi:2'-5' RNA ligase